MTVAPAQSQVSDRAPLTGRDRLLASRPVIDSPRQQPGDLLRSIGTEMYHAAVERGMSLSAMLEIDNPSTDEEMRTGLDCFSRMLRHGGVRVNSVPEWGVDADPFVKLMDDPQLNAMIPELIARNWRRTTRTDPYARALYQSDDFGVGNLMQAWNDQAGIRARALAPAIPLSALVAQETRITGDAYRSFYMTDDTSAERMVRVAEGSEVPRAVLTGGDHTIRLRKFGRAFEATYEVLRRSPIDRIAFHIARLAIQTESDKVAAALSVLVSGDGNSNTAATNYNLTTLDAAATAGTLTLKGWLSYRMKFTNPYMLTTVLVQEATGLQLLLLNVGSANVPLVMLQGAAGFGSLTPINRDSLADGVRIGWTADAPSLKIVGFDNRLALERISEIGANLQEVDRWITKQTQVLVLTEVEGYAVLDQFATKTLNVNA